MMRNSRRSFSGLLLAASNFGNFAFPMIRGIVLARLLAPEDFGLAISITTVASVVELISDVGLNHFAVRVADRNAVPTLHSIALIRGVVLAIAIALCGPFFAWLFKAPGTAGVYILVGLSSLIRGFMHLGVKTEMRAYNFAPEAITDVISHLVWTIVSVGAAFILRDYRAMAFGLVSFSLSYVVMTHLLSRSRWTLAWDRAMVRESTHFGRLLVPNGIAIAIWNMGDRTLIGSYLGLGALAYYSVLSTSAFTPRAAVVRFLNALMTPQFVNAQTQEQQDRLLVIWVVVLAFVGSLFAFGYMAVGQPMIALVFGKQYAVTQAIVALIAILSCIRFLATLPTPLGIAKADTGLILLNTTTAAGGLVLGLLLVLRSPTLEWMVSGMCVGELAALLYIIRKVLVGHEASTRSVWASVLPTIALVFACAATIAIGGAEAMASRIGITTSFMCGEIVLLAGIISANRQSVRDVAGVFVPVRH